MNSFFEKLKHMKGISLICLLAIAISVVSCSDDILESRPFDGYIEEDVFGSEVLLRDFVNGTYRSSLRHPFDDQNSLTDGLTDNAFNQHGSAEASIKVYTRAEIDENNGEGVTRNLWAQAFSSVQRINLFFDGINSSPVESAAKTQLTGEMRFLRAYVYFDLMRWYGGVPLFTTAFELDDDFNVSRNTVEEVGNFVIEQCDLAITELSSISQESYELGRASVEATMALKAKAALYLASPLFNPTNDQDKWVAARDANEAVMNLTSVSLVTDGSEYGALFRGESTSEVIFARYFTTVINQGSGVNQWLMPNSVEGWGNTTPTQDLVDSYELTNGLLPSEAGSGYDPQDPYINRDPRFYETILFNGAAFQDGTYDYFLDISGIDSLQGKDSERSSKSPHNASRTGYNFRKWVLEDQAYNTGNTGPWVIYRLGEFYLNYAEAEIALGNDAEARNAINEVRSSFGMPAITEAGAALTARYRRERRVHLVLEDHRFFDMRRWQIGDEVLGKPATGVLVTNDNGNMIYDFSRITDETRLWDDKMYLLPIPFDEIQKSGGTLTQNTGY